MTCHKKLLVEIGLGAFIHFHLTPIIRSSVESNDIHSRCDLHLRGVGELCLDKDGGSDIFEEYGASWAYTGTFFATVTIVNLYAQIPCCIEDL